MDTLKLLLPNVIFSIVMDYYLISVKRYYRNYTVTINNRRYHGVKIEFNGGLFMEFIQNRKDNCGGIIGNHLMNPTISISNLTKQQSEAIIESQIMSIIIASRPLEKISISYDPEYGSSQIKYDSESKFNDISYIIAKITTHTTTFEIILYKSICSFCFHNVIYRSNVYFSNS